MKVKVKSQKLLLQVRSYKIKKKGGDTKAIIDR